MKKIILSLALCLALVSCGQTTTNTNNDQSNENTKVTTKEERDDIEDVCNYFPKELIESAIGKPIVKVEVPMIGKAYCNYYTEYSETYDHIPRGDKPGGPHITVAYDTKDFARDRVTNEKNGTKYESDSSIDMDNFVMRNNVNKIWQTVLVLGDEKYIRSKG